MIISQVTIESVQNTVRIEEVVSHFLSLKKRGQNFWAFCPFHNEKTPSFSVFSSKGFYKCFGCNATGNVITFIQKIEGLSFVESVIYLAKRYGIPVISSKKETDNFKKNDQEKESLYILLKMAKNYYKDLLIHHTESSKVILPYLNKRSIPYEITKKFELGYSMDTWDGFYKFAISKGVTLEKLVSAGLVINTSTNVYDRFRGRLMFPIHNNIGQVVAFGARKITKAIDIPKYINSSETIIYQKGKLLYGLYLAKNSIKYTNHCYLVEGYTDVLAFHKVGIEEVVASSGTALTENQIDLLCSFTIKITLVFDGDQAGIQAALRGIDKLLKRGLEVKVILLPSGEDPDSYLDKVGKNAFKEYIHYSVQDFITFKGNFLLNQTTKNSTVVEQEKCIKDIVQSIIAIPNEIQRTFFLEKCSKIFSIEKEIIFSIYYTLCDKSTKEEWQLKKKYNEYSKKKTNLYIGSNFLITNKLKESIAFYEREIMRILLTYGAIKLPGEKLLYKYILLEIDDVVFRSPDCKILLDYCKKIYKKGGLVDIQCCLDSKEINIRNIATNLTTSFYEISEVWIKKYGIYTMEEEKNIQKISLEVILRLKISLVQELIAENREALKNELPVHEEQNLLKVHQILKNSECSIAKKLGIVVAQ